MPSRTLATLSVVAAGLLAFAGPADAASYPTVKKITPMTVSIGETMSVTGSNYVKGKSKNTVVFFRKGKRAIFVKADGLSRTRLTVVVPEKLRSSLAQRSGKAVATRFQIRILAKRFGKGYTALSKSPTVRAGASKGTTPGAPTAAATAAATPVAQTAPAPPPPDCDGDGQIDAVDADDDNDLLDDTLEETLKTNRCLADTDGDAMEDGWEYKSALDLNRESCGPAEYATPCGTVRPYPGKRAYPNPLDASDAGVDYDGDWLIGRIEHEAWLRKGRADAAYRTLTNMWYSEGFQASQDTNPSDGCRGIGTAAMPVPLGGDPDYTLDRENRGTNGLGCLSDDERDEDNDYLTNVEETNNELSGTKFWIDVFEEPTFKVVYAGTNWIDPDTDGDGVLDGMDDQDFDDFWNAEENYRGSPSSVTGPNTTVDTGLWVDPFNPCLPSIESRSCPRAIPATGDIWRPFYKDTRPVKRWPLYGTPWPAADPEVWGHPDLGAATLPPQHPIPRPF